MRKTKQPSVKQIMAMSSKEISKLSDKELRKLTVIMNSAANKRIKRAEKAGLTSGVIESAKEYGKFSVKGIENRLQLEAQFNRVRSFIGTRTSKVRSIKTQQRRMFRALAKEVNKELPPGEKIIIDGQNEVELQKISGLIWQQVDKLAEDKKLAITKEERYKVAARAYNVTTRDKRPIKTKRGLFNNLKKYYDNLYAESIKDKPLGKLSKGEQDVAEIYNNIT